MNRFFQNDRVGLAVEGSCGFRHIRHISIGTVIVLVLATCYSGVRAEPASAEQMLSAIVTEIWNSKPSYGSGRGLARIYFKDKKGEDESVEQEGVIEFKFKGESSRSDIYETSAGQERKLKIVFARNPITSVAYEATEGFVRLFAGRQREFYRRIRCDLHPETHERYLGRSLDVILSSMVRQSELRHTPISAELDERGILHVSQTSGGEGATTPKQNDRFRSIALKVDTNEGYRLLSVEDLYENSKGNGARFESHFNVIYRKYGSQWYIKSAEHEKEVTVVPDEDADPICSKTEYSYTKVEIVEYEPGAVVDDVEFTVKGLNLPANTKVYDEIIGAVYTCREPITAESKLRAALKQALALRARVRRILQANDSNKEDRILFRETDVSTVWETIEEKTDARYMSGSLGDLGGSMHASPPMTLTSDPGNAVLRRHTMSAANCLWQIACLFGKEHTLSEVAALCQIDPERGISLRGLAGGAKDMGLEAAVVRTSLRGLARDSRLAILFLDLHWLHRSGRAVILDSQGDKKVALLDGTVLRTLTLTEFKSSWHGFAVLVGPGPSGDENHVFKWVGKTVPFVIVPIILSLLFWLAKTFRDRNRDSSGVLSASGPAAGSNRKHNDNKAAWPLRLVILLLTVWVLAVFYPLVSFNFLRYDEMEQVVKNPMAQSLSPANILRIFTSFCIESYYPIRLLSFALDHQFWKLDPKGYHITNVIIHMVNVLLLFWLGLRLFRRWGERPLRREPSAPGDERSNLLFAGTAGVAACVFAIHPVVIECVAWVGAREELLMATFALACFHCWITIDEKQREGRECGKPLRFHVLSGMFFLFSCWSNVVGVVIAPIVSAHQVVLGRKRKLHQVFVSTWFLWLGAGITLFLKYLGPRVSRIFEAGMTETIQTFSVPLVKKPSVIFSTFWQNLKTLVWPADLSLIYPNEIPESFLSADVMCGLVCAILTLLLLRRIWRCKVALFALIWFLLALTPYAQVMSHHIFRADRFLYFPLAGLSLAAGYGLRALLKGRKTGMVIGSSVAITLCVLGLRNTNQIRTWCDTVTAFTQCARVAGDIHKSHGALGMMLFELGDYDGAIRHLCDPADSSGPELTALAISFAKKQDYNNATSAFLKALSVDPNDPVIHSQFAMMLIETGDPKAAIKHFRKAVLVDPNNAFNHNGLGVALFQLGDEKEAVKHLKEAARLDTEDAISRYNLGVLSIKRGKIGDAKRYWEQARRLDPTLVTAHDLAGLDAVDPNEAAGGDTRKGSP
jgi:Flp pilus assembly protein TadD